jgi:hypothetical protein
MLPPQTGSFRPGSRCEPGTEGEGAGGADASPVRVLRYCAFNGVLDQLREIARALHADDLVVVPSLVQGVLLERKEALRTVCD